MCFRGGLLRNVFSQTCKNIYIHFIPTSYSAHSLDNAWENLHSRLSSKELALLFNIFQVMPCLSVTCSLLVGGCEFKKLE